MQWFNDIEVADEGRIDGPVSPTAQLLKTEKAAQPGHVGIVILPDGTNTPAACRTAARRVPLPK